MRTDEELLAEVYVRAETKTRRRRTWSFAGAAVAVALVAAGALVARDRPGDTPVLSDPGSETTTVKPPVLKIEFSPEHPRAGEVVRFRVIETNAPLGYGPSIDAGVPNGLITNAGSSPFRCVDDASTSTSSQQPVVSTAGTYAFRYPEAGTFTVTATIQPAGRCSAGGADHPDPLTATRTITVLPADPATATTLPAEVKDPPTLTASTSNTRPRVGEQVTITAAEHGGLVVQPAIFDFSEPPRQGVDLNPVAGARFDCGDVSSRADRTTSSQHSWDQPGTYTVRVQVLAGDPCHGWTVLEKDLTIVVRP